MSHIPEVLKSALLGTDKYMPAIDPDLPVLQKLETEEKESTFLRQANLLFLMDEAGQPLRKLETQISPCFEEQEQEVSDQDMQRLNMFLTTNDEILFEYFISVCNRKNKVIQPYLVPAVLNKALSRIKTASPFINACGEAGRWLCTLNRHWEPLLKPTEMEGDWELGSMEIRKKYLLEQRKTNPREAVRLLEKILPGENAANRLELLDIMRLNPTSEDENFLLSLQKDKSQKVKYRASEILAQIEGTATQRQLLAALSQIVSVKEERHLLISKKKVLYFQKNAQIPETVFTLGIEKISATKGVSDSELWSFQILYFLGPSRVSAALQMEEGELLQGLLKLSAFRHLSHFVVSAVQKFTHTLWAKRLLEEMENAPIELLEILSEQEKPDFYLSFSKTHPVELATFLMAEGYREMKYEVAVNILDFLSKNPHRVQVQFYRKFALYVPKHILSRMQFFLEIENQNYSFSYFKNQVNEMIRVIETKQLILSEKK
ncbi:MAG: DUF5691 domain-containing protein [Bacteroidia bacterium]|nr:DUF5691 domain-containing protein [Bacteroidia bacterium]